MVDTTEYLFWFRPLAFPHILLDHTIPSGLPSESQT